ncbi:RagB/SusD family nutrient uptake outer membrane protein [Bacteroides fragilis]|nr:RagB/SusD family nutrient uptake outer membrane protein [Bacteroides fragilis]
MKEFRNRDSRLYVSMMFPFKGWHETIKGTFYFRWDPVLINKDGNESWTGIFIVKWSLLIHTIPGLQDYPVIRYAEVLLTYAKARIQNSGWDTEVQKALNDLRDRCGMPDVPATMPSKEEALAFVHSERRIELAAEGRFRIGFESRNKIGAA